MQIRKKKNEKVFIYLFITSKKFFHHTYYISTDYGYLGLGTWELRTFLKEVCTYKIRSLTFKHRIRNS